MESTRNGIIYILLPVHNRKETTIRFAQCLLDQTDQNYFLVLIDDGSTDGTAEAIKGMICSLTVLKGDGSMWWAGSLQRGYEWLNTRTIHENDIVLIINDDTQIESSYLANGRFLIEKNPGYQIGSICVDKHSRKILDRGATCDFKRMLISAAKNDNELEFMSTRGLFIKAKDFILSQGFVPQLFPHYFSDYEFTHRLKNKYGLKMMTSDSILVLSDSQASGIQTLRGTSPLESLKLIFSNRCVDNPLLWTRAIGLYCVGDKKLWLILRVWMHFFRRWLVTFPLVVSFPIFLIVFPVLGFLRGAKTAFTFNRYHGEP